MKFTMLSFAVISTALMGSAAGARGILIDFVDVIGTGTGPSASLSSNVQTFDGSSTLSGVSSLSFSPGALGTSYSVVDMQFFPDLVAYNWGDPKNPANPFQQVVLQPFYPAGTTTGPTSEFALVFGYSPGDTALANQTAFATVNGITYSATNPTQLSTDPFSPPPSFTESEPDVLVFIGGILQNAQDHLAHGWTESAAGTVSAPEIDSASAAAALTLLAGGITVLLSRSRRRAPAHRA